MTWIVASGRLVSGSCGTTMEPGEPVRRLTVARSVWCRACAKATLGEEPPAERAHASAPDTSTPAFESIAEVARRVLPPHLRDFKRAASGESDDD